MITTSPETVIDRVNSIENIGTRTVTMGTVMRLAERLQNTAPYQAYWKALCDLHTMTRGTNEAKYNETERAAIWDKIDKVYQDNQKCENDTQVNRFLLASFYLFLQGSHVSSPVSDTWEWEGRLNGL